jgi:predicted nuclease of predicted toxin-antitoxin system
MRLLADMGIGLDVVNGLRAIGHEAIHLIEEHLQRTSDDEILAKAIREQRIILT